MILRKKPFENIVGKEENAGYQHVLFFPQYFFIPSLNFKPQFNCHLPNLMLSTSLRFRPLVKTYDIIEKRALHAGASARLWGA